MQDIATGREAQRRKTRARVLDAAIVEFQRAGAHSADINAIVEAAGVARSTFYFHFPTKEHVLLELIRRDEDYLARLGVADDLQALRRRRSPELPDDIAAGASVITVSSAGEGGHSAFHAWWAESFGYV